jgi:polyhydroxyalkanoate synthesis regulator phasin
MPNSAKRRLAAGAVGLAVLAGTGGAYAAGQSSTPTPTPSTTPPAKPKVDLQAEQKAFLDDLAKRLNVTRDQLDTAIKGAAEARIDAAVAAGKMTKEQGDAAKQALANGVPALGGHLFGGGRGGPGGGPGHGPGGFGHGFGAIQGAADYLGLTEDKLRDQLQAGKSLSDIAKATSGKTVDGLKAAMKAAAVKDLDQAVKDGHLTSDQRDKMVADLDQRLDDIVNNTPPKGAPDRPKFRWR